jgi:hypothetical protein
MKKKKMIQTIINKNSEDLPDCKLAPPVTNAFSRSFFLLPSPAMPLIGVCELDVAFGDEVVDDALEGLCKLISEDFKVLGEVSAKSEILNQKKTCRRKLDK